MQFNKYWCLLVRKDGAPVPRWIQSEARWKEGVLLVKQERDPLLGRSVMVARLATAPGGTELVPPLIDAQLVLLDHARLVLSGMERDELTRKDVAQTWLLIKGRDEPRGAGMQ